MHQSFIYNCININVIRNSSAIDKLTIQNLRHLKKSIMNGGGSCPIHSPPLWRSSRINQCIDFKTIILCGIWMEHIIFCVINQYIYYMFSLNYQNYSLKKSILRDNYWLLKIELVQQNNGKIHKQGWSLVLW